METNKFYQYRIFLVCTFIFFNNFLFSQEDISKINYQEIFSNDQTLLPISSKREFNDPLIILDSNVVLISNSNFIGFKGSNNLGDKYAYEIGSNKLLETSLDPDNSSLLKLAKFKGSDSYLITDGTFIVEFNEQVNINEFAKEFGIEIVRNFSKINTGSFQSKDFKNLSSLILNIRSDQRIKNIRYDLINPKPDLR